MNIQELVDQRVKCIEDARTISTKAYDENRDLSAEEKENFDKAMADSDRLKGRIDTELKLVEEERDAQSALERAPKTDLSARPGFELTDPAGETRNLDLEKSVPAGSKIICPFRNETDYRSAFWSYVRQGRNVMDREEYRALQVGTDTEGGHLVPTDLERTIIETIDAESVMRGAATVIQTSADRDIPIESTVGVATWTAEEAAYTESDPAFGKVTLSSYKDGVILKVSEELLADEVTDLLGYIGRNIGRKIGTLEEAAFVDGDGTAKPTGIVTGADAGITAATNAAILPEEYMDLYYKVKPGYRRRGTWILHSQTVLALRKVRERTDLTPDGGNFIWHPGLIAGVPDTLLSRPVLESDDMPQIATVTIPAVFVDISFYWIADRGVIGLQRLSELYAANGQVGFRAARRVDGKLTLGESVKKITMPV